MKAYIAYQANRYESGASSVTFYDAQVITQADYQKPIGQWTHCTDEYSTATEACEVAQRWAIRNGYEVVKSPREFGY